MDKKVLEVIKALNADRAKRGADFKGYEVYIPVYSGEVTVGFPLVVMKKGDEVRLSTEEESLEYLDCSAE